jgi:hypothetical protein
MTDHKVIAMGVYYRGINTFNHERYPYSLAGTMMPLMPKNKVTTNVFTAVTYANIYQHGRVLELLIPKDKLVSVRDDWRPYDEILVQVLRDVITEKPEFPLGRRFGEPPIENELAEYTIMKTPAKLES